MTNNFFEILENFFIRIDKVNKKIDKLDSAIRERISIFEDTEESTDPEVIENLKLKEIYLDEHWFITSQVQTLVNGLDIKPTGVKTGYFVERFKDTQQALDFINSKIGQESLFEGTRDLFTGLGYSSKVTSMGPERLYYVKYKFPKIFGFEVELC